ncbi:hypothetical protein [Paraburkholderia fungorum]|uniref:hypothetical protein n=1 Tax=Paraburkholderia fungorum TaxID=134537 RepID=UPI002092FA8A|nr:hypothetical protein [Paraburkholderia fungorum]USU15361.1 hypothetical protein NFE55_17515 [Paraburkholderia fungorum]USU23306.1 hypothetical protein NFS19_17515 [Paraburkholderia fungorum]
MTKITKTQQAAAAKERGETKFKAVCHKHGETDHSANDIKCVACKYARHKQWRTTPGGRKLSNKLNRESAARIVATAEGKTRYQDYRRTYRTKLRQDPDRVAEVNAKRVVYYETNAKVRGHIREETAAKAWCARTGGTLSGQHALEQEAMRSLYGNCRDNFEIDHAIPKVSYGLIDGKREHIVTGTHTFANLVETPKVVNRIKCTQFAPDTNRFQRPANRHPGGAFDPSPTAHEMDLIANAEYEGTPASASLEALRGSLDTQARVYEAHVKAVEENLSVRYTNAIALMLGYMGAAVGQQALALAA